MINNYLIIGRAKTGTTVVSKNIQNTVNSAVFYSEPQSTDFFTTGNHVSDVSPKVVKIIFEHWNKKTDFRDKIVQNKTAIIFGRTISIVRDPRDELISRLYYAPYPRIRDRLSAKKDFNNWLMLLEKKERDPEKVTFASMLDALSTVVGYNFLKTFKAGLTQYVDFLQAHDTSFFKLKYENFIRGEKEDLEHYLGFTLSDNNDVGRFKRTVRTASYDNWKSVFQESDCEFIESEIGSLVTLLGYHDWGLSTNPEIAPSTGSRYVRRLIREAAFKQTVLRCIKSRA